MSANAIERLREQHLARDSASGKPRPDNCDTCADLAAVEGLLDAAKDDLIRRGCLCLYSRCPLHGEGEGALAAAVRRVETGQ